MGTRLSKTHFLPFEELTALTSHYLERRWENRTDLLGLAWCDGSAVSIPVTGVVRLTDIDYAAPHSRDIIVVMFFTLTVRLQKTGREKQRVLVSHGS